MYHYMISVDDPAISYIRVRCDSDGLDEKYYYDSENPDYFGEYSSNLKITISVEDGYRFVRWRYYFDNEYNGHSYENNNTFNVESGDIFVWAEITEDENLWNDVSYGDFSDIDTEEYDDIYLEQSTVYRIAFSCKYNGDVTLYSEGDIDTIGYLSSSTRFDNSNGEPSKILASNDDSDDHNFSITYEVSAGEKYYLFVRCYDAEDEGDIRIYIVPPTESGGGSSGGEITTGGGLYMYTSIGTPDDNPYSRWVKVTPYIYTSIGGWKHWKQAQTNLFTSIGGWEHWVSEDS